MKDNIKKEIAYSVIKILKSRFDSFPDNATIARNAPFHKAFLKAFTTPLKEQNIASNALINLSSWMHGLNTTLGQSFFEDIAQILSCGEKRKFAKLKVYSSQTSAIAEIMTNLKNGKSVPNKEFEEKVIYSATDGKLVEAPEFTADCWFEDDDKVVAIEMKSVKPNSGEVRGEKQKILTAKAALKLLYPDKNIFYYFGFPFDPTADEDTSYDKVRFCENSVEMKKFLALDEMLISEELWSFLSDEPGTMRKILDIIKTIATEDFYNNYGFINNPNNMFEQNEKYKNIVKKWFLYDELMIAENADHLSRKTDNRTKRLLHINAFNSDAKYNYKRAATLIRLIK